ncbi:MAG TPA: hypothetical protein PLY90_08890 [Candidatus Hydrogenedentes bacterium]|jgi:hypothetical protein|nr:MAG: hypothetical protein BWY07_02559 [Candidatus Hydrogenedentes bacterium ADurb.Bin170]HOD94660.1 hypothetical protein [Candidatus Hydrogenedentota bacterium]HOM48314.1 hypothetical protein [Candidatus Hydrogenedentota bacterium]HOR50055.1 hypothetical protein [Candidatus Hydrogenedentota bacterium]HPK24088.1 hypothetical protein [Candidatus Hydrogenedentota bacterium]
MSDKALSRYDFFHALVRWALGTGLAALVAWLWRQGQLTRTCAGSCAGCMINQWCAQRRDNEETRL